MAGWPRSPRLTAPLNLRGPPLPATRQDLLARLAELGIATTTLDHEAVFTVAESSKLERELPGGHTKNLFLKDKKGKLYLVVALGHAHIDLKTLPKVLGVGSPELRPARAAAGDPGRAGRARSRRSP